MNRVIKIKNIGAIKNAELQLESINVFMGPQASGKSTIAKIISQVLWAEKNYITTGKEYNFYRGLIDFHNMDKGYFTERDLEIVYSSPWVNIQMRYESNKREPQTTYQKKSPKELYANAKIEYIPAERSFVASIPNIGHYNDKDDSIVSFLRDWFSIKSSFQRTRSFDVYLPDLAFSYRYREAQEEDILKMQNGAEVYLQSASSGQQSLLPLLLVAEEVMQGMYSSSKIFSPIELAHIKKNAGNLGAIVELLGSLNRKSRSKAIEKQLEQLWRQIGYRAEYGCTHLIIEEPELNLYPSTQRGLLNRLVAYLSDQAQRCHTLTLTTHSPFILYALNNCMIAGGVSDKKVLEDMNQVAISAKDVGLWLVKDGVITRLQDENTHRLKGDIFNMAFQESHERMFELLEANLSTYDINQGE